MKNKKILLITIVILLIIILSSILFIIYLKPSNNTPKAIINGKAINLEPAKTLQEQEKGLMYRKNLNQDSGMLFIYPDKQIRQFWMKNTLIPLDMVFIDSDNKIIDIQSAEPCTQDPCKDYVSKSTAKYVLELNAGYTKMNNISIGDKIELTI